jgi:hypothetical protein
MDEVVLVPVRMLPGDVFFHPEYGLCTVKKISLFRGNSPLYICVNKKPIDYTRVNITYPGFVHIVHLTPSSPIFPSHIVGEGFVRRELFKRLGGLTDPRDLICLPGDGVTFKPYKNTRETRCEIIEYIEGYHDPIGGKVFNYYYTGDDDRIHEISPGSVQKKTPYLGLELLSPTDPQKHCSYYRECICDCENDRCRVLCNRK